MRPLLPATAFLAAMLATPAWSQSAGQPLNLKLPPSDLPATASTAPKPASAPGVYYGDTSGRTATDEQVAVDDCDDATYDQPQVHGSVGMGVMSGSHVDGSYQQGRVNISKAFGSCDHPTGGISVSVGAGSGHFHGRGH
ncbi:MAG TPA: hypothetical protein VFH59_13380 [Frateuria sp.]|uniref:hypothetical protein n=1 Tax=Frateuria sp. TaxID=2211372 RepID=UPI002D7E61B4|nr:hypothetical protein [Frateuria sp.]HET6806423.1 hypothetical protein [Frateuria sp.]